MKGALKLFREVNVSRGFRSAKVTPKCVFNGFVWCLDVPSGDVVNV